MKTLRFQCSARGVRLFTLLLFTPALALLVLQGCTDLEESPTSSITPENFNQSEQEVLGSLASVYAQLRHTFPGTDGSYWYLAEVSSDEMIVPTRGSDWLDNGRWLELQRHNWTANSPAGLTDINSTWVEAFTGVIRANVLLEALQNLTVANQAVIEAELRTLRAVFYYMLMDTFGGVPIVTTTEIEARAKATRAEVFQFIGDELQAARAELPDNWPAGDHGRMTKGAADAVLANMYLNAAVFTTDAPSVTAYNSCMNVQVGGQTACDAAIAAANNILNSGVYSLATDWRSNFEADNSASPENILVVKHMNEVDLGLRFLMSTLHYNQFGDLTPWNGFASLAGVYEAFDADDQRREIFLVGPQVDLTTGAAALDRQGNPLVFTQDIQNETQATEAEGPRFVKWPPDPNRNAQDNGNDFAYFRLAEIFLIKAEALNELAPGSGEALGLLNTLRERVFEPDEPLITIDRDVILQERLFELTFEGKRRQDLIRHGLFIGAWRHKPQGAPHLVLMPIPQSQLDANPMLAQNPGY